MADPFSIISGIAGVATAGAALASVLYDIIHNLRDAPREMVDIARGVRELSSILRELRRILKRGTDLFKRRLFRSLRSAINRIRDIHEEIDGLLAATGGRLARIKWVFRKHKAAGLLAKIESHKSTVSLFSTTMLLAVEERKHTLSRNTDEDTSDDSDERRSLRKEAETLVRATERDLHRLLPQKTSEDAGTQTEGGQAELPGDRPSVRDGVPVPETRPNNQIEKYDDSLNDTAQWLYQLVFMSDQGLERQSASSFLAADVLGTSRRAPKRVIVDRLLQHWTNLESAEIRTTRLNDAVSSPWETRLINHSHFVDLDDEDEDEDEDDSEEELVIITPNAKVSQPGTTQSTTSKRGHRSPAKRDSGLERQPSDTWSSYTSQDANSTRRLTEQTEANDIDKRQAKKTAATSREKGAVSPSRHRQQTAERSEPGAGAYHARRDAGYASWEKDEVSRFLRQMAHDEENEPVYCYKNIGPLNQALRTIAESAKDETRLSPGGRELLSKVLGETADHSTRFPSPNIPWDRAFNKALMEAADKVIRDTSPYGGERRRERVREGPEVAATRADAAPKLSRTETLTLSEALDEAAEKAEYEPNYSPGEQFIISDALRRAAIIAKIGQPHLKYSSRTGITTVESRFGASFDCSFNTKEKYEFEQAFREAQKRAGRDSGDLSGRPTTYTARREPLAKQTDVRRTSAPSVGLPRGARRDEEDEVFERRSPVLASGADRRRVDEASGGVHIYREREYGPYDYRESSSGRRAGSWADKLSENSEYSEDERDARRRRPYRDRRDRGGIVDRGYNEPMAPPRISRRSYRAPTVEEAVEDEDEGTADLSPNEEVYGDTIERWRAIGGLFRDRPGAETNQPKHEYEVRRSSRRDGARREVPGPAPSAVRVPNGHFEISIDEARLTDPPPLKTTVRRSKKGPDETRTVTPGDDGAKDEPPQQKRKPAPSQPQKIVKKKS